MYVDRGYKTSIVIWLLKETISKVHRSSIFILFRWHVNLIEKMILLQYEYLQHHICECVLSHVVALTSVSHDTRISEVRFLQKYDVPTGIAVQEIQFPVRGRLFSYICSTSWFSWFHGLLCRYCHDKTPMEKQGSSEFLAVICNERNIVTQLSRGASHTPTMCAQCINICILYIIEIYTCACV
jgi:hypothetical protein